MKKIHYYSELFTSLLGRLETHNKLHPDAAVMVHDVVVAVNGVIGDRNAVQAEFRPWVERFGRRGTEQNELLRSEFGENSFKIQEFSLEN